MMKTTGIYAGSFDPITYGHLNIVEQATKAFDNVIIAIGSNSSKKETFSCDERLDLVNKSHELDRVKATKFSGLLVEFCKSLQTKNMRVVIVRGLRAVSDFEAEMSIAHINQRLDPDIPTVFFPTSAPLSYVSSSAARELARHLPSRPQRDSSYEDSHALLDLVPFVVAKALIDRLGFKDPDKDWISCLTK